MTTTTTSEKPSITLYRGWLTPKVFVWSPFVTKLELRLRHASLPYTALGGAPSQSPTGKIPYITLSDPSSPTPTTTLSDTALITSHLTRLSHLPDLTSPLTPTARLADAALRALLEDKLYFLSMRERWIDNYYVQRDHILGHLPRPARVVVGLLIHRSVTATLYGQGSGRFGADEVEQMQRHVWESIEAQLVVVRDAAAAAAVEEINLDKPFWVLGGEEPTEADMTLFGFVVSALVAESGPRSRATVRACPALMEYARRIFTRYFADYEFWG